MIPRYSRPEMAALWSDEEKFRTWLDVELAVVEALEADGTAPAGTAEKIRAGAVINVSRVEEIEDPAPLIVAEPEGPEPGEAGNAQSGDCQR